MRLVDFISEGQEIAAFPFLILLGNRRRHHSRIWVVRAGRMDRLLHEVLQTTRLLQIIRILSIDDFEEDLLHVCLIRLVLHDLAELNAVHLGRDKPLHLVEKVLLLAQDGLECRSDLGGHESFVSSLRSCCRLVAIFVLALIVHSPIQLLQEVVVVTELAVEHLDRLEQTI